MDRERAGMGHSIGGTAIPSGDCDARKTQKSGYPEIPITHSKTTQAGPNSYQLRWRLLPTRANSADGGGRIFVSESRKIHQIAVWNNL